MRGIGITAVILVRLSEVVEQRRLSDADDKHVPALDVRCALPRHDDRGALLAAARARLHHTSSIVNNIFIRQRDWLMKEIRESTCNLRKEKCSALNCFAVPRHNV